MTHPDKSLLEAALGDMFPQQFPTLHDVEEDCDWTKTYRVSLADGGVFFLKGTPHSRPEAKTTATLYHYCPHLVAKVLVEDLSASSEWRWFLLENAGQCSDDDLSLETALKVAFALGDLQREVCADPMLKTQIPVCTANDLQRVTLEVCDWMLPYPQPEAHEQILELRVTFANAGAFFADLQHRLAELPSTCVHGDVWAGNVAIAVDNVRLLDWGDAIWGSGGCSIVNLIMTSQETLAGYSDDIWQAYGRGWGKTISPTYIAACAIASIVHSALIDVEIARCCQHKAETLPGLLPGLVELRKIIRE